MDIFSEIFVTKPNRPIYHYTSQRGLLGIVNSKSIWATEIHYLNDSNEFLLAINLAREVLRGKRNLCSDKILAVFQEEMEQAIEFAATKTVYVCSFSEEKDLLSQWRSYCPGGIGFSLGFDPEKLALLLEAEGYYIAPCIYDQQIHIQIISELLDSTIAAYEERNPNNAGYVQNQFVWRLLELAAFLKHSTFSEEREWRVISKELGKDPQKAFREGASMLIPYSILHLHRNFPINEIVIGPTPHLDLSKNAILDFLDMNNIKAKVELSSIPFRGW